MSRRFVTLLERTEKIRQLIEREQRVANPKAVRLMRLKRLQLRLAKRLREMSAKQLVAMASAPRLRPEIVFRNVGSVSTAVRFGLPTASGSRNKVAGLHQSTE